MDITEQGHSALCGRSGARLAQAITLVESNRADHRVQATALLAALFMEKQALRMDLSGDTRRGGNDVYREFRP